jgi:hypothetical protein
MKIVQYLVDAAIVVLVAGCIMWGAGVIILRALGL